MNIETGEIINSSHYEFDAMFNRGVLMPLDEAGKTTTKELKKKLARTQVALDDGRTPLSKNEAKRRRKLIKNKKVRA